MNTFAKRIFMVAVALMISFGVVAPAVSAQTYVPAPPPTFNQGASAADILAAIQARIACDSIGGSTFTGVSPGAGTINVSAGLAACAVSAQVDINPTVFSGPIPANRAIKFEIPACASTVTLTAKLRTGATHVQSWPVNRVAGASCPAAAGSGGAGVALAFTGSEVQLPLALGATLVGAGGLVLLGARKRRVRG